MIRTAQFLVLDGAFTLDYDPRSQWVWLGPGRAAVFILRPDEVLSIRDPLGGQAADVFVWECLSLHDRGAPSPSVRTIESLQYALEITHDDTGRQGLELHGHPSATDRRKPLCNGGVRDNLALSVACLQVGDIETATSLPVFAPSKTDETGTSPGDVVALAARRPLLIGLRPAPPRSGRAPLTVEFTIGEQPIVSGGLGARMDT